MPVQANDMALDPAGRVVAGYRDLVPFAAGTDPTAGLAVCTLAGDDTSIQLGAIVAVDRTVPVRVAARITCYSGADLVAAGTPPISFDLAAAADAFTGGAYVG